MSEYSKDELIDVIDRCIFDMDPIHEYCPGAIPKLDKIKSIIEQHPTKEEAIRAMKFIQGIMDDCQSPQHDHDDHDCNHCVNRKYCDEPKEILRKALGIEEGE